MAAGNALAAACGLASFALRGAFLRFHYFYHFQL